jgi:hypothetical protein
MSDLSLLLPEWQGYGVDSAVAAGARAVAGLFDGTTFVEIDAPDEETLTVDGGVLGLASIAARLPRALAALNERHPARIFTIGGTCGVELAPVSFTAWSCARSSAPGRRRWSARCRAFSRRRRSSWRAHAISIATR